MTRIARWGMLLLAVAATGTASAKRRRIADAEPARCERFSQETDKGERAIDFHLKNLCSVEIKCSISWDVRCEEGTGGGPQSLQLVVAPGASEVARASAQVCGESAWAISAATWSCKRSSSDTAAR